MELPADASVSSDASSADVGAAFAKHGFVILRGYLSGDVLDEVQREVQRAVKELPGAIAAEHCMYDDADHPSTLKQIQQLWRHDAFFGRLMLRLQGTAEAALGEDATPQNMQYFNKPPLSAYRGSSCSSSRPTPPHQDGYYFMLAPPRATTMWLALDEADEGNGCLRYVLGSAAQAAAPRPHGFSGVLGFSQTLLDYGADDVAREVAMRARPGDLLVHHALLVHRAEANASETRHRRAIGAIFYGASAEVDAAAYEARQLEIRRRAAALPGQSRASVGLDKRPGERGVANGDETPVGEESR